MMDMMTLASPWTIKNYRTSKAGRRRSAVNKLGAPWTLNKNGLERCYGNSLDCEICCAYNHVSKRLVLLTVNYRKRFNINSTVQYTAFRLEITSSAILVQGCIIYCKCYGFYQALVV
jgi:hypothetical protein